MVEDKYRSGIRLLSDQQIESGLKRIKEKLSKEQSIIDFVNCSVIVIDLSL
jgi:hypothetical protein